MKDIKVLDCTFRDGGYYNDWDFPRELAIAYLQAMAAARVDAIEIGFRIPPEPQFLGAFTYSTDDFLASLPLPAEALIGVMVNAKDMITYPGGPSASIEALFSARKKSPVGLVRIAAHFRELDGCRLIASELKERGYVVGLNMMQASLKNSAELSSAAADVESWGLVDVLYFADSLGNMSPEAVKQVTQALAAGWHGPMGVHTHNNKGQASVNVTAALEAGATWIDGTVLGMGRGAGNAQTEYLLLEMNLLQPGRYNPEAMFPLVMDSFEPLRKKYDWGPNLLYYLSGSYGIHPTYVQEMLGRGRYDTHDLIGALSLLRKAGATSYSDSALQNALQGETGDANGSWTATGWAEGRDVLLVASGPGAGAHRDALLRYVKQNKPVVICLNVIDRMPAEYVTAYAACNPTRLLIEADKYRSLTRPLIAPRSFAPKAVRERLSELQLLDYGVEIRPDTFVVTANGCVLPTSIVAGYGIAVAEAAGARRILLAGFDGYSDVSDPRRQEMVKTLRCYATRKEALPLLAVTPTSYDVQKSSIYAPQL